MQKKSVRAKQFSSTARSPGQSNHLGCSLSVLLCRTVFLDRLEHTQKVIMQAMQTFARMMQADIASAWLRDGDSMHRALIINRPVASIPKLAMVSNLDFDGLIPPGQGALIINDIHTDERFLRQETISSENLQCFLCNPLTFHDQHIGVLYFMRRERKPFSEQDAKLLALGCEMLAVAIDHCSFSPDAPLLWNKMLYDFCENVMFGQEANTDYDFAQLKPVWLLSDDLPKGIHPLTLARVFDYIQFAHVSVSSADIANVSGLSLASARRYLNHLHEAGQLKRDLVYTPVGRPSYIYSLSDPI